MRRGAGRPGGDSVPDDRPKSGDALDRGQSRGEDVLRLGRVQARLGRQPTEASAASTLSAASSGNTVALIGSALLFAPASFSGKPSPPAANDALRPGLFQSSRTRPPCEAMANPQSLSPGPLEVTWAEGGAVRSIGSASRRALAVVAVAGHLGTPAFMAPERSGRAGPGAGARQRPVQPMYELLRGRRPKVKARDNRAAL